MLPNIYISTTHLKRVLRNNCFSGTENVYFYSNKIRTLHVKISLFKVKYAPSSCLSAVDVRINQIVIANFLPIHLNGVSSTRIEQVDGRSFALLRCNYEVWVCYL
jgi:hypothetical protein